MDEWWKEKLDWFHREDFSDKVIIIGAILLGTPIFLTLILTAWFLFFETIAFYFSKGTG